MLFYFLISIVFIAEIIIVITVISNLVKFDKYLIHLNYFVNESKPEIKDIMKEFRKLSEQLVSLAPLINSRIKSIISNIIMSQIKSILGGLTYWLVKREIEKRV